MGWLDRLRGPAGTRRHGEEEDSSPADAAGGSAPEGDPAQPVQDQEQDQEPDRENEPADPTEPAGSSDEAGTSGVPEQPQQRLSLVRHSPFAIGFLGTAGALICFFLLQQLTQISGMLILLVIAMFLAIGLNPLVESLTRRGVRRGLAVAGVLVLVVAVLGLFFLTVAPVITEQITLISNNAPSWLDRLQNNGTVQDLEERYDLLERSKDYLAGGNMSQIFGGVLDFGLRVLSAIANAFIVLVLTVYFLVSLPSITEAGYRLAPASRRPRVRDLGDRVLRSTGAYVSGAFLVGVCAGVSTLIFTFLIGLSEYSFALAFIVGLLSLIPVIGAFVSAVLITLIGLTVSPGVALACIVYYLAYQQFEQYVIYPRIMARAVDLPGTVTVVAALVGGSLLGITGALLAVPTAAALVLLHKEVFLRKQDAR